MLTDDIERYIAAPVAWLQAPEALATSSVFCALCSGKGRETHSHGHCGHVGGGSPNTGGPALLARLCGAVGALPPSGESRA